MDLILRRARLHDGRIVDIGIADATIVALEPTLTADAPHEIAIDGRLTIPAFVNGQLHACKSFWRRIVTTLPPEQQTLSRFEVAHHVKQRYTVDDVVNRVDEVMQLAIQYGTCAIRLFADVDGASGLTAVKGLLRIRERYQPWLTVQVVAFPQDGITSEETPALMRDALAMGADIVGGIPWIEQGQAAQQQHVKLCFALAQEFDRDLHFVCDDVVDPASRTLEMVARHALSAGWLGRVSATQCAALSCYPAADAADVIQLVKAAGMTIFSNSHVGLVATDFPARQPWPRGITRVHELLAAGVPVACGQDDIDNWFYPFGRNDLLEVAHFMAHNGHLAWPHESDQVLPMVTTAPAHTMGLANYGFGRWLHGEFACALTPDWHSALQFQVG
ncbi:MAG: amidohydrolase family protein [Caldilineaceae bacterium]